MSKLFFSEYVEGSGGNQALEIYNGTDAAINLAGYTIQPYADGSLVPNNIINLTGQTIAAGDVLVIVSPFASAPLLALADFIPPSPPGVSFNGNDAIVLAQGTTILDVIGQVGFDPGAGGWVGGGLSTDEQTLRRKVTTLIGDSNPADPFDPSLQWEGFLQDTFAGLGSHAGANNAPVLTAGAALSSIEEDVADANNLGNAIADLLAGLITDPDFNPQGLAITGVDNTNGTWQYSTNGGRTWQAIAGVAPNNALTLLGSADLYLGDGTAPATQGWLALASVLIGLPPSFPITETVEPTDTRINTNADEDIYAGYSNFSFNPGTGTYSAINPFFPTLDHTAGYALSFNLQVLSDAQTNPNRAGFSIIAVSDDATKAVELAFQDDKIFAQTLNGATFVAGETQTFDTTQATQYTLEVQGSTYDLLANGTSILTGALRDYAPGNTNGAPDPYGVSNFLFFGDDTTSAQGEFRLSDVTLKTENRIRFVPNADYSGSATFAFRAWDTTDGSGSGQFGIDASQTGGENAFSAFLGTGSITVTDVPNGGGGTGSTGGTGGTGGTVGGLSTGGFTTVFNFEQWVSFVAIRTGKVFQSNLVDFNIEIGGLRVAPLFDETKYLRDNPDVALAVRQGTFQYGFEHFVLFGINEGRSCGDWFDEDYYLAQNPDVDLAINRGQIRSAISHFFAFGHREKRNPSKFFNSRDYLLKNPDVKAAVDIGKIDSAFEHYAEFGAEEGRLSGFLFDESFYLQKNPDVAAAVSTGVFALGLYHFVSFGQIEGRDPSAAFDQSAYLARYGDVAAAVAGGIFASGFEHYLLFGRSEGRITV